MNNSPETSVQLERLERICEIERVLTRKDDAVALEALNLLKNKATMESTLKFQDTMFAVLLNLIMNNLIGDENVQLFLSSYCGVGHVEDAKLLFPSLSSEQISRLNQVFYSGVKRAEDDEASVEKLKKELIEKLAKIAEVYGSDFVVMLQNFGDMSQVQQKALMSHLNTLQNAKVEAGVDLTELIFIRGMISSVMEKLSHRPGFFKIPE